MLLLTVKGRKASFTVMFITADSQLRMRDTEGFCDNLFSPLSPRSPRRNGIDMKLFEENF